MAKKPPKRALDQVQISVSLPKTLLDSVDHLAEVDGRSRSNWIVRKLQTAVDDELRQKNIALLPAVADAEDLSSSRVAESPNPTSVRITKNRTAIRGMIKREKSEI